jgi:hypothetical protein
MQVASYDEASFQSASVSLAEDQKDYAIADVASNKRSVTFFDEYIILHEYQKVDAKQRKELWYTHDEYALISLRNLLTVKLLRAGCFEETEEQTFTGLEHCLTEDPEREFDTVKAVLGEQHRQTASGVLHAGRIARASRATSKNHRQIARVLGLRDAQASRATSQNLRQIAREFLICGMAKFYWVASNHNPKMIRQLQLLTCSLQPVPVRVLWTQPRSLSRRREGPGRRDQCRNSQRR